MPVCRLCPPAAGLLGLLLLSLLMAPEKPGSCPNVDLPQLGICEDQCEIDSQCPGNMKCCRNGCGKVSCVTPRF
uniref:WAP four-disulfide core domain 2 n=1 Tax=Nannospalax galili TaxID=1026970 RepID=A0A8C6RRV7_NANGA